MRVHTIDLAKGIGILLVVFGHAWRGGQDAGLGISGPVFTAIDNAIYAFHMPLFFFLSALLFTDIMASQSLRNIASKRIVRLLWPLCLWTWIFFALKLLAGDSQNQAVALENFPLNPIPPYAHLWFLWALFVIQLVVLALHAGLLHRLNGVHMRLTCGVLAVILAAAMPFISVPSPVWGAAVAHLPYFLAGLAIGHFVHQDQPIPRNLIPLVGIASATAACVLIVAAAHSPASTLHSIAIIVLLWSALTSLNAIVDHDSLWVRLLLGIGTASMAIYLCHTIFSAGFREALIAAGIDNLAVHLLGATLVGVVFPILLYRAAKRAQIARLMGF